MITASTSPITASGRVNTPGIFAAASHRRGFRRIVGPEMSNCYSGNSHLIDGLRTEILWNRGIRALRHFSGVESIDHCRPGVWMAITGNHPQHRQADGVIHDRGGLAILSPGQLMA
jgi:hypothetical protein